LASTCTGRPREKCERIAEWTWPLAYFKIHGIEQGMQWPLLGWLAARYARDFTTDELAGELWEVIEASDQGRPRWTYRQIYSCAARAGRFIDREDTSQRELYDRAMRGWPLLRELAQAQARGRSRPARKPGTRQHRKPGRAA
jgi:hypothetical protein